MLGRVENKYSGTHATSHALSKSSKRTTTVKLHFASLQVIVESPLVLWQMARCEGQV